MNTTIRSSQKQTLFTMELSYPKVIAIIGPPVVALLGIIIGKLPPSGLVSSYLTCVSSSSAADGFLEKE